MPMLLQTGLMTVVTASKSASTIGVIGSAIDSTIAAIASMTVLITRVTASMHAWIAPLIVHLMPAGTVFQTVSIVKVIASTAVWTIGVIELTGALITRVIALIDAWTERAIALLSATIIVVIAVGRSKRQQLLWRLARPRAGICRGLFL